MSTKKSDLLPEPDPLADVVGAVDTKLEEEGEWFRHASIESESVGPNEIDGFRHLLLDENGNGLRAIQVSSRHTKAFEADARAINRRALRMSDKQRDKFQQEMQHSLTAKHCIRGWDFTARDGSEIPLTRELAERILSEPRFRHHRDFITVALGKHEGVIERTREEDAGN